MIQKRRIHSSWLSIAVGCFLIAGCQWSKPAPLPLAQNATAQPAQSAPATLTLDELKPPIEKPSGTFDGLPDNIRLNARKASNLLLKPKKNRGRRDKSAAAANTLINALKDAPDDLKGQYAIGRWYAEKKQFGTAVVAFRTALKCAHTDGNPIAAETLVILARLLNRQGHFTAALECFTELSRRIDEYGSRFTGRPMLQSLVVRPEQVIAWRGRLLLKLGRTRESAELLEQAFSYNRSQTNTARWLMEALIAERQFDRARSLFVEIAADPAHLPQSPEMAKSLCLAAADPNLPGLIAAQLLAAERLDGTLAVALAEMAKKFGAAEQAETILYSLLKINPGSIHAARQLALQNALQGQHEKALELLANVLMQKPSASELVRQTLEEMNTYPTPVDLERMFTLRIKKYPKDQQYALHFVVGLLAHVRGEDLIAARQYRQAISDNPKFFPSYESLIDLLLQTDGKPEQLERVMQFALRAAQGDSFGIYLAGKVHLAQGNYSLAENELDQAAKLNKGHLPTWLLLGRVYTKQQRHAEAASALVRVLAMAPNNDAAYRALFEAYLAGKQPLRASAVLKRLIVQKGRTPAVRAMAVRLALGANQLPAARKALDSLKATIPDHPELEILSIRMELAEIVGPLDDKEFDSFVERLTEVIRKSPGDNEPKDILLKLILRLKKLDDPRTMELFRNLYEERAGQSHDLTKMYAALLLRSDRYADAVPVLEKLAADKPGDLDLQLQLVDTLIKLDRLDEAADRARKAHKILDQQIANLTKKEKGRIHGLRKQKFALYTKTRQFDDLKAFASRWVHAEPDEEWVRWLIMTNLSKVEQYDLAHALIDDWIEADKGDEASLRGMKIFLYQKAEQYELGEAFTRKWLDADPNDLSARSALVAMLFQAGKSEQAQAIVDEWAEEPTTVASTQPTRMPATQPATVTAQPTTQTTMFEPRPVVDPLVEWAQKRSVWLLVSREKFAQALERLARYESINDDPQMQVARSHCLSELGRHDEAVLAMEKAFQLQPNSHSLQNNLGYLYADNGVRLDRAERLIRQSLVQSPNETTVQDSLGWVFYKTALFNEAGRMFEQILAASTKQRPTDAVILDHAGDVMWRLGRKTEAVELWRKVLEQIAKQDKPSPEMRRTKVRASAKIKAVKAGQPPAVAPLGEGVTVPQ